MIIYRHHFDFISKTLLILLYTISVNFIHFQERTSVISLSLLFHSFPVRLNFMLYTHHEIVADKRCIPLKSTCGEVNIIQKNNEIRRDMLLLFVPFFFCMSTLQFITPSKLLYMSLSRSKCGQIIENHDWFCDN